jgi:nitrogen fixation/metabolism regulation signal transduction histidine kinase
MRVARRLLLALLVVVMAIVLYRIFAGEMPWPDGYGSFQFARGLFIIVVVILVPVAVKVARYLYRRRRQGRPPGP